LNLTDEDNPIDEISRIETQLEELVGVSERCRKININFHGGNRRRRRIAALYDAWSIRIRSAIASIAAVPGGIASLGSTGRRLGGSNTSSIGLT